MLERYLQKEISTDLQEKMVFISGPRQVGKTTLAVNIGKNVYAQKFLYLNWDDRIDRRNILDERFESEKQLLIFDEIHKYKNWKTYLKGIYDKHKNDFDIVVTGSARLDIYRRGGDSLLGRYRRYRLHPLSLNELRGKKGKTGPFKALKFDDVTTTKEVALLGRLMKFGGFPEIYLKQSEKELRRWHNERPDLLIKEDIRDIENIRDLSGLQVLAELLPEKVGSPLSINAISEDLSVNYRTAALWIDVLERFYFHFRVYPYQNKKIKSLKKEAKLYLWDWSELKDEGLKFENLVASHLLKFTDYLFDAEGFDACLYYLRDIEQREVDFLMTVDNKPWFAVEVKSSSKNISKSLGYFRERLGIPFSYQVVNEGKIDFIKDSIRVISADKFFTALV